MTAVDTARQGPADSTPPGLSAVGPDLESSTVDWSREFEVDIEAIKAARKRQTSVPVRVISTALTIISVALLGFTLYVAVFSRLHHDRAQFTAYADFRQDLALGTAPVAHTRPDDANKPLADGTPVAVLEIPKLRLKEVVFEGTSGSVLEDGPGHLRTTPLPGETGTSVILGRNTLYGGPFHNIGQLAPGDTFTITSGVGVGTFTVIDVRRAGDLQPALPAGAGRVTLTTADGSPLVASGVLRVDADLTSAAPVPADSSNLGQATLTSAEPAMATDTSAWIPLVLLGQALVIAAGALAWARHAWGRWPAWLVGLPVLLFLGIAVADQAVALLPNLM